MKRLLLVLLVVVCGCREPMQPTRAPAVTGVSATPDFDGDWTGVLVTYIPPENDSTMYATVDSLALRVQDGHVIGVYIDTPLAGVADSVSTDASGARLCRLAFSSRRSGMRIDVTAYPRRYADPNIVDLNGPAQVVTPNGQTFVGRVVLLGRGAPPT